MFLTFLLQDMLSNLGMTQKRSTQPKLGQGLRQSKGQLESKAKLQAVNKIKPLALISWFYFFDQKGLDKVSLPVKKWYDFGVS